MPEPKSTSNKDWNLGKLGGTETKLFFTLETKRAGLELWVHDNLGESSAAQDAFGLPAADGSGRIGLNEDLDLMVPAPRPVRVEGFPTTSSERMTSGYTAISESVYFTSADKDWRYLYRSDGTTVQLIWTSKQDEATHLVNVAGTLFFVVNGHQVWKVVGDTAKLVAKLQAATGDRVAVRKKFESLAGGLLFLACKLPASRRWELWVADKNGARRLATDLIWKRVSLMIMLDKLWFTVESSAGRVDLWSSDGTKGGTTNLLSLGGSPRAFKVSRDPAKDMLWFTATEGGTRKLFKITGSNLKVTALGKLKSFRPFIALTNLLLVTRGRTNDPEGTWSMRRSESAFGLEVHGGEKIRGRVVKGIQTFGKPWPFEPAKGEQEVAFVVENFGVHELWTCHDTWCMKHSRFQNIRQLHVVGGDEKRFYIHGTWYGQEGLWVNEPPQKTVPVMVSCSAQAQSP